MKKILLLFPVINRVKWTKVENDHESKVENSVEKDKNETDR